MRAIVSCLSAVLFAASLAAEERPLRPINRDRLPNEVWCGNLFTNQTISGAAEKQVNFAYLATDGSVRRDSAPSSRTEVVIREGDPMVSRESGEGEIEARFYLNRAKYDEAKDCLPPPK